MREAVGRCLDRCVKLLWLASALAVIASPATAASSAGRPEWIEVAPEGHYFQTASGAPFIVIGQNDAITWPYLSDLLVAGDVGSVRGYLERLRESGVNTMRVMFEYAQFQFGLAENPLGEFRQPVVEFWDRFIELAEEYGIYLIVTPWDPFWMQREWDENPYNVENGGIMADMKGFLTDPDAVAAQKRRFAFMVDRWGGSPAILAWELMNEIELWWGARPREIADWISEMARFIRQRELERYGRTHLLTASLATPFPGPELVEAVLAHPDLDFATTHQYAGPAVNAPVNTVDAADAVALATAYAKMQLPDGRPYLDTESGPIDAWIPDGDFDAEYYHNMSWAHLASGGAGQGLRWPYRNPHVLSDEMRAVQAGMARFVKAFDWRGFVPRPIDRFAEVRSGTGSSGRINVYGVGDERRMLLWLLDMAPARRESVTATEGARLVIRYADWAEANGVRPPTASGSTADGTAGSGATSTAVVEFWDTRLGGKTLEISLTVEPGAAWEIPLPRFEGDLAIAIYLKGA
ncbi:MAG: cellulase family glycosylhydrolase [Firmicutes bacterium]|nr:cellulase family glycosylhydrolase [Bacillota bacterium]MDH7494697.1 cellulase family glycosylhydrolase [Bacillota bacterium]